ncbi:MAG: C45 family autoproteolytic acyltransferase/hydrolase [Anaerolineales bacterium]
MEMTETLVGTNLEIGRQRGEALRPLVWEHVERMKYLAVESNPSQGIKDIFDRFITGTGHLQAAEKWAPQLLDEVKGISQGSNVQFNDIFAMCCLDELWCYSQAQSGKSTLACSSVGCFREEYSPALLGQNLDTDNISKNLAVVLHIKGVDQPETFIVCHVSNLGWLGLNRTPLGVCVNTLHLKSNRNGLPIQFMAREILRKRSLVEATDFLSHTQQGAAQNFMIGNAEKVVDFEGSARGVVQYIPFEGARRLYHTNHPLGNNDYIPMYPVIYPNTLDRFKYLEYRLKDQSQPITIENIKGILCSHSGPICVHSNNQAGASSTWVSVIYSLSTPPELYVAKGNPCDVGYTRYTFQD